jgi:hypothetical protein
MAWSTPLTAVTNAALTAAQWNASVRDNLAETAPAKATTTGRIFVTTGANGIAERIPSIVRVTGGGQGTTSTSFTDLTTVGPTISTLATGVSAIFAVSAYALSTVAQAGAYMGVAVSGASTVAADTNRALRIHSEVASVNQKVSYVGMFAATLTAGNNTFQAKYASTSGASTATFDERELLVIPL